MIVNVQRSGPSTGQATKPAQGDVMQARWGTHGDHEIIALSPSSIEECFYMTIEAFNLAEKYRNPVIILLDGLLGHIREPLTFPAPDQIDVEPRKQAQPGELSFGGSQVPPMMEIGSKGCVHITGSTHLENGIRDVVTESVHRRLVTRLVDKIASQREQLTNVESLKAENSQFLVISYGSTARPARGAVEKARQQGLDVGFVRLKTIWPFPQDYIRQVAKNCQAVLVPEMNLGQLNREIERFVSCPVVPLSKIGGIGHNIEEIFQGIKKLINN